MKSGKKVKRYLKSILGTGLALSMVLSAFPTLANTEKDDASYFRAALKMRPNSQGQLRAKLPMMVHFPRHTLIIHIR